MRDRKDAKIGWILFEKIGYVQHGLMYYLHCHSERSGREYHYYVKPIVVTFQCRALFWAVASLKADRHPTKLPVYNNIRPVMYKYSK